VVLDLLANMRNEANSTLTLDTYANPTPSTERGEDATPCRFTSKMQNEATVLITLGGLGAFRRFDGSSRAHYLKMQNEPTAVTIPAFHFTWAIGR
jgi:hypothetical protein